MDGRGGGRGDIEGDAGSGAAVIVLDGVAKRYRSVQALAGVSLRVAAGEIFGLLGHNGAGKTTTVRILSGRARPTAGRATILGLDVVAERRRIAPLINVVFEDQNVYPRMTGREDLRFFCDLYRAPSARADELLDLVGLREAADRR